MKYIVKTKYEDFEFERGSEALDVANKLAMHSTESATVMLEVIDDKAEYHLKDGDKE